MNHAIRFPRHAEDLYTKKRTLFHSLLDGDIISVGDGLLLCAHPNFPRVLTAVITKVDQVKLCDLTAEDLVLLNVDDAASYLARWDELHPEALSSQNPMVYRIEFQYGSVIPDPEWCLAG